MRKTLLQPALAAPPLQRMNVLRETLQWEVLAALHGVEAFRQAAFIGGTSLRLLRGLARFSEDLDFSTTRPGFSKGDMESWGAAIVRRLAGRGIPETEISVRGSGNVVAAEVRWPNLLRETGISPLKDQKLMLKLEVDTNPPSGAVLDRVLRSVPQLMSITTYDLPSLMAGKLHALLARPYTKGRDWYDLVWYCGRQIEPNLGLLDNALTQIPSLDCTRAATWRESLAAKAKKTDWKSVRNDVGRFLEHPEELALFDLETMLSAIDVE